MGVEAAVIGGGLGLASGILGSRAANKAANTQANAANRAADLQYQAFLKQLELQEPFRQGGLTAQNRLMTLLGLQSPASTQYAGMSRDQLREMLLPQFTSSNALNNGKVALLRPERNQSTIDEAGLNTEIDRILAQQAQGASGAQDPDFGKYARDFSMSDFEADPGYGFRLSEGLKALDRQAAARGGLISGAALKASQRYGQDMASQEYQNAFNRYQVNRSNQLNPLQSLMGAGQTSANTLSNAAGNYASSAGDAYMNAANARASGYVGGTNSLINALGQGFNAYQNSQYMNMLGGGGGGGFTPFDANAFRSTLPMS